MGKKERRTKALKRLETQLITGEKTVKKTNKKVQLSDADKKRIEKEMEALKN